MQAQVDRAVSLLERLIAVPSISRSEAGTAQVIYDHLESLGLVPMRVQNNIYCLSKNFDNKRSTLMLNSHHDTVKPSPQYTFDPYTPLKRDGRLYGLGSNDAGASVVSLIETFAALCDKPLPFNLLLAVSAEEEVSGENGTRALLPALAQEGIHVTAAIVGEPTGMNPAIAERGLVVLDCEAHGVAGHAARNEGVNAIYKAIDDIEILRNYRFEKESATLGPIKITVSQIEAGRQHNVVPDSCKFVVDLRTTDAYANEEVVDLLCAALKSDIKPRSTRIRASVIDINHPLVRAAQEIGGTPYVSPTTSDMALMHDFPTLKIGPGDSARSHTADEYIVIDEIKDAIDKYIKIITNISI